MCRRVVCGVVFVIELGVLSIRGRMTSPSSWTNFRVKTLPLFFSMSGQLSFMVCAISEMRGRLRGPVAPLRNST